MAAEFAASAAGSVAARFRKDSACSPAKALPLMGFNNGPLLVASSAKLVESGVALKAAAAPALGDGCCGEGDATVAASGPNEVVGGVTGSAVGVSARTVLIWTPSPSLVGLTSCVWMMP